MTKTNNPPIFKDIFGAQWEDLPLVMKRHYANRVNMDDINTVSGNLDVSCSGPIKLFAFIFRLLKGIPAYNEKAVPVTVTFKSTKGSAAFQFNRVFHFKGMLPYIYNSRMVQIDKNEVIEIMPYGIGWRLLYLWDGEKVILKHKGYVLSIFGKFIPLPLTYLIGKGHAEETAIDDSRFNMFVHISHPWWGKVYEYKGQFHMDGTK